MRALTTTYVRRTSVDTTNNVTPCAAQIRDLDCASFCLIPSPSRRSGASVQRPPSSSPPSPSILEIKEQWITEEITPRRSLLQILKRGEAFLKQMGEIIALHRPVLP